MLDFLFECLIMGDSIATGLSTVKPSCKSIVKSGITSDKWLSQYQYNPFYRDTLYKVVVISLGTNDFYNGKTEENLYNIRRNVRANMVIWVLPNHILKPNQRDICIKIANEFEDKTIDINMYVGNDGIHPNGLNKYKEIADKLFR